jgi:hypothetical protein
MESDQLNHKDRRQTINCFFFSSDSILVITGAEVERQGVQQLTYRSTPRSATVLPSLGVFFLSAAILSALVMVLLRPDCIVSGRMPGSTPHRTHPELADQQGSPIGELGVRPLVDVDPPTA